MSFHFVLNSSQWLAIFLAFCPRGGTTILKRKCGVEEAVKKRPDKASAPYVPQFGRLLMKNTIQRHDLDAYRALGNSNIQCKEQYLVPIAWHVIQNLQGKGNVPDVQLETQIRVLNEAFSNTPFRFKTHSVDRTTNDVWFHNCIVKKFEMRPVLAISPATTLNVYTCQFRKPLVLGDFTFPWRDDESDVIHAVAIHYETLPNGRMATYNLGHILVHQIGHFFGLYDVCEGGCDGEDDEVADTPRCRDYTHVCTDEKLDTCKAQSGLDPINNYMSDMEDNCTREFSPGQIDKMIRDVKQYKPTLMENIYRPCRIDAAFRWSNGFVYLFLGSRYYRYNETRHGIDPGYPRPIRDHWNGIPSSIDGVFRYVNGITYFFKGNQYYRFNDSSLSVDPGYPRPISDFWLGVPDDIDDVINYLNGYTYFFKGTQYYRFNPNCQRVDPGYPRQLSSYWDFPNDTESAFTWYNGGVYVFKDTQTWFFLHSSDSIGILSGYPESVTKWWNDVPNISGYAAFRHVNGSVFFFKGDKYWSYNEQINQVNPGYPRSLAAWGGVPADVDAAFVWTDGYAYFFKDNIYFRYDNATQHVQDGYPRNISSFWKGVPNNVSAVFRYTDDITYFFKDSFYYPFNDSLQGVDPGYPQPIASFWKDIPDNLDTVFTSGSGHVFFFKQNLFYRFNQIARQVDVGYPKSIALWKGILYQP